MRSCHLDTSGGGPNINRDHGWEFYGWPLEAVDSLFGISEALAQGVASWALYSGSFAKAMNQALAALGGMRDRSWRWLLKPSRQWSH